ncbi:MAG: PAS domain S-box protein, partial [Deltaproteobacteria bacterium]|nr:PAS domain S-box protein [Deltaproteobacteria bacterium]
MAEKVAIALIEMPRDCPAAKAAKCAGWTVPLNYQPVHACLKELKLGPYRELGKITPADVFKRYWEWILATVFFLVVVAGASIFLLRLNRKIRASHGKLQSEIDVRKRMENALLESEKRYRHLVEKADDIIYKTDSKGHFTFFNAIAFKITGYPEQELMGKHYLELIRPDYHEDAKKSYGLQLKKRTPSTYYEFPMVTKDGKEIWLGQHVQVIVKDDRIEGVHAVARDITKRKRAEKALLESEERFKTISITAKDAILMMDNEGNISFWNPTAEEIFGYSSQEAIGKELHLLLTPKRYHEACYKGLSKFKQSGQGSAIGKTLELEAVKKNGTEIPIELSLSAIKIKDGWHSVGIIRDITERKRAEEALKEAKMAAEAANRTKSEFLASMSHEIRTPMNAIIGMADLLSETPLTPEQEEYVQVFQSAGENLLNIINDILDISKVEAGHLDLEEIDFDLGELVEKTCEIMALRAHEKALELACHVTPDVPTEFVGDPVRLRQIFVNLIGNAVKFTEKGEVFVEVKTQGSKLREQGEGAVELTFSVADTGIGIPPEKVDTIFDIFTQADSSTTRKHGGTGLGLTISKRLVELMGGRIWVESQMGQGSTFYFTASFKVQAEPKRYVQPPPVDIKGLKTLVVDDNATNRVILREMLSRWGALVTEAEDGERGLAELK